MCLIYNGCDQGDRGGIVVGGRDCGRSGDLSVRYSASEVDIFDYLRRERKAWPLAVARGVEVAATGRLGEVRLWRYTDQQ